VRRRQGGGQDPRHAELVEIGVVARELGVRPARLRDWERRYRLIVAHRGEGGQRRYDAAQVALLRRVLEEISRGTPTHEAHKRAVAPHAVRSLHIQLRPSASAPLEARWAVDALLEEGTSGRFAFDLRLLASELVTNAVLYGAVSEPIQLEVRLFPGWADLRVRYGGGLQSMRSLRSRRRDDGRGLEVVDALASVWSVERGPSGAEIAARLRFEDS
jgi:DNA-binding transcriptional MerR regulator/anti-sigma regulatory factor (Ser/Thr protein kinase)